MRARAAQETAPRNVLLSNALSLFGGQFLAGLLSFSLWLVLPRFVLAAELGDYFVALAVATLVGSVAQFGMQDPLIRQLHLRPKDAETTFGAALGLRLGLSLLVLAGCQAVIWINHYPAGLSRYVWLLAGAEVFNGTARLFYSIYRARERMGYEAAALLIERGMVVLAGGGLVAVGVGDMTLFCQVSLAAAIMHLVLTWAIARAKFGHVRPTFSWRTWRPSILLFVPYAVVGVLTLLYLRIDTILLMEWSDKAPEAVAWYGIAYSWAMALAVLPGAVMAAAYPTIARVSSTPDDASAQQTLSALYTRVWKVLLLLAVPSAVMTAMCATKIIALFYPTDVYPPGTIDSALRLLGLVSGLLFLSAIVSNVLRAANRWAVIIALVAGTAVVNIAANAWAIPRYHHEGAAWALVAGEAFYVGAGAIYIRRRLTSWTSARFLLRLIPSWIGLGVVLVLTNGLTVFLQAPASLAFYVLLLGVLRAARRNDWTLRIE